MSQLAIKEAIVKKREEEIKCYLEKLIDGRKVNHEDEQIIEETNEDTNNTDTLNTDLKFYEE